MDRFGLLCRNIYEKKKITQRELAAAMDLSLGTCNHLIRDALAGGLIALDPQTGEYSLLKKGVELLLSLIHIQMCIRDRVTADGNDVVNEENEIDKDYTFFCDETGARVESAWVYTTSPATADDDADADEYWYYLKSSGKVATGKQANVKGQTFIFGDKANDNFGQMLTGWVAEFDNRTADKDDDYYIEIDGETESYAVNDANIADVYYCLYDEDKADGHVQKNKWIKTWRPEDAYDEDEDDDKFWYWVEKDGKVYVPENADAVAYKYALGDGALEIKNSGYQFGICLLYTSRCV